MTVLKSVKAVADRLAGHLTLTTSIAALKARFDADQRALHEANAVLRDAASRESQETWAARRRFCDMLPKDGDGRLTDEAEITCQERVAQWERVIEARAALREAQAKVDALEARIAATNQQSLRQHQQLQELRDAGVSVTLADVIAQRDLLQKARAARDDLHQRILEWCPPTVPDLAASEARVARVLADVLVGRAEPNAGAAAEQAHAAERQAHDQAEAERARSGLLLQGLEERLAEAETAVKEQEEAYRRAASWHIQGELERVGAEYRDAAERLFASHARMVGLSRVLSYRRIDQKAADRIGVERASYESPLGRYLDVLIPSLRCLKDFQPNDSHNTRDDAYEAEVARLRAAGLPL